MGPEFGKPIQQLPLIPADVLKKHRVNEPLDTRLRSARPFQALWREDRDLPTKQAEAEHARNPVARAVRTPQFRLRVLQSGKLYVRKYLRGARAMREQRLWTHRAMN